MDEKAPEKATAPLLADIKQEIGLLGAELGESLQLRWQLAWLELQADLQSTRRLAIVLAIAAVMVLTALPLLVACLAVFMAKWLAMSPVTSLAIFAAALLSSGPAGGYLAWCRFRRRFVALQQTLEELREDLLWLQEWTGKAQRQEQEAPAGSKGNEEES